MEGRPVGRCFSIRAFPISFIFWLDVHMLIFFSASFLGCHLKKKTDLDCKQNQEQKKCQKDERFKKKKTPCIKDSEKFPFSKKKIPFFGGKEQKKSQQLGLFGHRCLVSNRWWNGYLYQGNPSYPPPVTRGLIAGLIKGNQWLINP